MRAGLESEQAPAGFVPSLNTEPEIPPAVNQIQQEANSTTNPNNQQIGQLDDDSKQIPNLPE